MKTFVNPIFIIFSRTSNFTDFFVDSRGSTFVGRHVAKVGVSSLFAYVKNVVFTS